MEDNIRLLVLCVNDSSPTEFTSVKEFQRTFRGDIVYGVFSAHTSMGAWNQSPQPLAISLKKLGKDKVIDEAKREQVGPRAWRGLPKHFSHLPPPSLFCPEVSLLFCLLIRTDDQKDVWMFPLYKRTVKKRLDSCWPGEYCANSTKGFFHQPSTYTDCVCCI